MNVCVLFLHFSSKKISKFKKNKFPFHSNTAFHVPILVEQNTRFENLGSKNDGFIHHSNAFEPNRKAKCSKASSCIFFSIQFKSVDNCRYLRAFMDFWESKWMCAVCTLWENVSGTIGIWYHQNNSILCFFFQLFNQQTQYCQQGHISYTLNDTKLYTRSGFHFLMINSQSNNFIW